MSSKDRAPFRAIPASAIKTDQDKDLYLVYVNKAAQTVEGHLAFVGESLQDVVSKEFLYYARMTPEQLEKVRADPGIFFVHQVTLERAEKALRSRDETEIKPPPSPEYYFRLHKGVTMYELLWRHGLNGRGTYSEPDDTYSVKGLTDEQAAALKADPAVIFSGQY